jgi:DNA-binding MarR family transcriptional regulator
MSSMPASPSSTASIGAAELAARLRVSVWRTARRMRQESAPGITPTLHAALHTVDVHGPMTAGQLAAHENVSKPTMTRTIGSLLARGLIARTPDPLDGRVSWLTVTPEGRALLQRGRRRTDEFLSKAVKRLSPKDRALLARASELLETVAEVDLGGRSA